MKLPTDATVLNSKRSSLELLAETNAAINHAHHLIDELSVRMERGFVGGDLDAHHDAHLEEIRVRIQRARFKEQAWSMTFLGLGLALVIIAVLSAWALTTKAGTHL